MPKAAGDVPRELGRNAASGPDAMTEPQEESPPSRRLLIVDDDRLILKIVHEFFSPHGYQVDQAEDGAQALHCLEQAVPDIIVADVLMPNLDGWDLFDEVRRRPSTAQVPFIFLTTERDLPQRLRGFHMGADDYVTKPFDVEELHARVERILLRQEEIAKASAGRDALLIGTVGHLPLSDLLQILSLNGKDGVVVLKGKVETGVIVFEAGNIIHAACGGVTGVKALYRVLGWSDASFRVLPPADEVAERTIEAPTTNVLMDGLVSLDEWNRLQEMLPDARTVLALAPDAKQKLGSRRLAPAEVYVLERAEQTVTVGEVIEASPLPDADLAEAICTLLAGDVLHQKEPA